MNESSVPAPNASSPDKTDELLRHLPAEARAAFRRFQAEHDAAALDPVISAILEDYIPRAPARPIAECPPETKLIEDLGFDSLAITELVFFTEELFGITIANEEVLQVQTIGDLRAFVRRKVAERVAA